MRKMTNAHISETRQDIKISIVYLRHEESMIGVQYQLVEDLFSYQKGPFENFCDLRFEFETS